jgi:hypothetical protein
MNMFMIYGIILIGAFSTGFAVGYHQKAIVDKAAYSKELKIALDKERENVKIVHDVEKVYVEKLVKGATVYKTIHKDIVKYVPIIQKENSSCNLTIGTVRLLNNASTESMPSSSRDTLAEGSRPSTITGEDFIKHTERVVSLYNRAKTQCNSLIDLNRRVK